MHQSIDRILTTHTGSLPRPQSLLDLLKAKDDGRLDAAAGFEKALRAATVDIVAKQISAGIDIVNDGEMSKIGYATYVKDRLSGFDAEGSFPPMADVVEFPGYLERLIADDGLRTLKTPACNAQVGWKNKAAV